MLINSEKGFISYAWLTPHRQWFAQQMIKREFIIPQRVCALGIQPPWDSSAPQIPGVSVACALTQEDAACLWPSSPKGSKKNSDSKQLRVSHKTFLCSMTGRDPESGCLWYPLCLAVAWRNTCTLEYKAKNGRAHVQQRKLPEPKQRVNLIDFRICRDLSHINWAPTVVVV